MELDPDLSDAQAALGDVSLAGKDVEGARKYFGRVLEKRKS